MSPHQPNHRKVVSELTKVWESVVAKGKQAIPPNINGGGGIKDVKKWVIDNSTVSSLQSTIAENVAQFNRTRLPSANQVMEETRMKVGRLMSAYEELIGMREVRSAHERVLTAEAKFIECQAERRSVSKQLTQIQNQLKEIRGELDRTQRGDELYLDLIKKEISATKEERIVRKLFEDWERTEREVFSELSSALRFSHEKERAQNEKTKYWSIVGSVIGAALGILGTTINNRMKQSHLKRVLEETSLQVAAIQSAVENLTVKVAAGGGGAGAVGSSQEIKDLSSTLEKQKEEMQTSLLFIENLIRESQQKHKDNNGINKNITPSSQTSNGNGNGGDLKSLVLENKWNVATMTCCVISLLLYKFT